MMLSTVAMGEVATVVTVGHSGLPPNPHHVSPMITPAAVRPDPVGTMIRLIGLMPLITCSATFSHCSIVSLIAAFLSHSTYCFRSMARCLAAFLTTDKWPGPFNAGFMASFLISFISAFILSAYFVASDLTLRPGT